MSAVRVERFAVIELPSVELLDLAVDAVESFRDSYGPAALLGLGRGNAYASVQCVKPADDDGEFVAVLVANPRGLLAMLEELGGAAAFGRGGTLTEALKLSITDAIAEFQ